jgi:hypothetical protein
MAPAPDIAGDTGETPVVEVFVEDEESESLVSRFSATLYNQSTFH